MEKSFVMWAPVICGVFRKTGSKTLMQLKSFPRALAAAVGGTLMIGVSMAHAQQTPKTADMAVNGTIVPGACTVHFIGLTEASFENIDLSAYKTDGYRLLVDERAMALGVDCPSSRVVTVSAQDTKSSSAIVDPDMARLFRDQTRGGAATAQNMFGLGTVQIGDKSVPLGAYALRIQSPYTDNRQRTLVYSDDGGKTWAYDTFVNYLNNTPTRLYAASDGGSPDRFPVLGKTFQLNLSVAVALNKAEALQLTENFKFRGETVFTVNYQ
jgi:hypothetical protein